MWLIFFTPLHPEWTNWYSLWVPYHCVSKWELCVEQLTEVRHFISVFFFTYFFSGFHRGKIYIVYSKVKATCFGAACSLSTFSVEICFSDWSRSNGSHFLRVRISTQIPVMLICHGFTQSQIPGLVPCVRWVMTSCTSFPVRWWKLRGYIYIYI